MEAKIKHLDFIQDIIKRMANNSFLLRGWSITLVTTITGFAIGLDSVQDSREKTYLFLISTALVLIFWLLDAYYLSQERAYRGLYNDVRKKNEVEIDFNLDARAYLKNGNDWFSSMFSAVFCVFYLPTLIALLILCHRFIGIDVFIK